MSDAPTPEMIAKALREAKNPVNKKLKPMEMRSRGYQLYKQEAMVNGEPVVPYEQWILTQDPM